MNLKFPAKSAIFFIMIVSAGLMMQFFYHNRTNASEADAQACVFILGDVGAGRRLERFSKTQGDSLLGTPLWKICNDADIVLANLEGPLTGETEPHGPNPVHLKSLPEAVAILRRLNISIVNLANNHIMDYGMKGFAETIKVLKNNNISFFGAGENLEEARNPAIIVKNGITFGFLGYLGLAKKQTLFATEKSAGVAPADNVLICEDIKKLKKKVDIVIVTFHWGKPYQQAPTPQQRDLARQCIRWGADVVVGHHPHVIQGLELYKKKLIAYSVGNFYFYQERDPSRFSLALKVLFTKKGFEDFYISAIYRPKDQHIPQAAEGAEREQIYQSVKNLSAGLGTSIDERHFSNGLCEQKC